MLLEKLNLPSIMFASSFELKQSCGTVGPVKQGCEELKIQNNMDRNLIMDSVSLGLKAIKVSETKAVVPFDKKMESEMQEAIVNMVSGKYEVESEEEKIQRLVNYAKGQTRPSGVARLLCVLEQRGLVVVKKEKGRKVNTAKSPNTGENSVKEVPTQPAAKKHMKDIKRHRSDGDVVVLNKMRIEDTKEKVIRVVQELHMCSHINYANIVENLNKW